MVKTTTTTKNEFFENRETTEKSDQNKMKLNANIKYYDKIYKSRKILQLEMCRGVKRIKDTQWITSWQQI